MKTPVYNLSGEKIKEIEISSRVFGVKAKSAVIHQVVMAQMNNARQVLGHTKDRGEVSGGGKKPWKQKGTGRARHGSIRSPLWRGGGITFGPRKDRNFSENVNQKQKQLALFMCLSDRLADNALVIFDKLELKDGKTKELNGLVKNLKLKISDLKDSKKFLLVLDKNDKQLIQAGLNLKNIRMIMADSLNCVDVLNYDALITSEEAVKQIDKHYKLLKLKK